MVQTISTAEAARRVKDGAELIDVRTELEFAEVHAEPAKLVPLDRLDPAALEGAGDKSRAILVICKSGARARKAADRLAAAGFDQLMVVEGGTDAWVRDGHPSVRGENVMSLERQVRIAAGSLALTFGLLGALVHPAWAFGAAFIGAGLIFAGLTNFCGMGLLLARMPWNRGLAQTCCTR
jgi:rhodanese-related sulfurtransferase